MNAGTFVKESWWLSAWMVLLVVASGILMFIAPGEEIALWSGWKFFGLPRQTWRNVHVLACLASLPLLLAWVWIVLRSRPELNAGMAWRILGGVVATLLLVGAANFKPFPLDQLLMANHVGLINALFHQQYLPPFSRPSQLTLEEFARLRGMDPGKARFLIIDDGFPGDKISGSLEEMANKIGTSPMAIYSVIKPLEGSVKVPCLP